MSDRLLGSGTAVGLSRGTLLLLFGDGRRRVGGVGASGRWGLAFLSLLHRTSVLHCLGGNGAFVDKGSGERGWGLLCAGMAGLVGGL